LANDADPAYHVSTIQIKEENQQDEEKPDLDVADAIALFEKWILEQKTMLLSLNNSDGSTKSLNSGFSNNKTNSNTSNEPTNPTSLNNTSPTPIIGSNPAKSAGRGKSRVQGGWSGNRK
jgi:hypothetical protein